MPFASANSDIFDAISVTGAVVVPDIRNRETDIPAVLFGLEDSGATNDSTGTIGPYHSRYIFACLHTSRINADALATRFPYTSPN